MKNCSRCKVEKPFESFYRDPRLSDGRTSACKECIYKRQLKYRDKNYFMTSHHNKSSQCRRQGVEYDLDKDYLESIWTGVCPVFGFQLVPRGNRHNDSTPHLDRLDPEKGYVRGNVVWLSRKANLIKSNASTEDVFRVYKWMKENI